MNQDPEQPEALPSDNRRQILLDVLDSIALHRDLSTLLKDLAGRLPDLIPFDTITLTLHDAEKQVMRLHSIHTPLVLNASPGAEVAVDASPGGLVWETQQPLLITQESPDNNRFRLAKQLMQQHAVQAYCILPLTTVLRRLGAMGFGTRSEAGFSEADIVFLQKVVKQVAVAVDNALHAEGARQAQEALTHERDRLQLLLDVNNAVVSNLALDDLFHAITDCLRPVFKQEYTSLALYDSASQALSIQGLNFSGTRGHVRSGMSVPLQDTPSGLVMASQQAQRFTRTDLERLQSPFVRLLLDEGIQSVCSAPLMSRKRLLGTLNTASTRDQAFSQDDLDLLTQVGSQIAIALENALAYQEIAALKDKLAKEKLYLEDEIRTEYNFEEIIGESVPLKRVLKEVETVGPTDSTVLIQGETGTGKELIARALHMSSQRRERAFVKINCAAIPSGLLESELFGHEKGAFTGAIAQKIGRFELADHGTLFLDEIGDIPAELQPKLLRVLQEQEFERLGGTKTIRVNVRVIGATNQDLADMVERKQFRSDLYYRLNVFPILLPPLRDRPQDIPILIRHFAQKLSRGMHKPIDRLPTDVMAAWQQYPWPGNIRELANVVERAVIVSPGRDLLLPMPQVLPSKKPANAPVEGTLESAEREHILGVLQGTDWVIGGPDGAAQKLGMKRSTLYSKMQKLGISRQS